MNKNTEDNREWQQAENVADGLMEQAERAFYPRAMSKVSYEEAEKLRDEAIFYMLRAILIKLR